MNADIDVPLLRLPLFAGLPDDVLARLSAVARATRYQRGAQLFAQGDAPGVLHMLLEGQVGLLGAVEPDSADKPAERTVVEILDAGEAFVAAAVLTGQPYMMGAVALAPCRVLELPREALLDCLRVSPDLSLALMGTMARHFRMLVREVKDLKLKSASERLALYLLGLTPRRDGAAVVRLPHNKTLIAARIGVRPETLSRAFAQLRGHGVTVEGHRVAIADAAALGRFCRESADPT